MRNHLIKNNTDINAHAYSYHPVDGGFSASSRSNQHDAVSHKHRLVELNDLEHLFANDLKVPQGHHVLNLFLQSPVVMFRNGDSRKQVLQYRLHHNDKTNRVAQKKSEPLPNYQKSYQSVLTPANQIRCIRQIKVLSKH